MWRSARVGSGRARGGLRLRWLRRWLRLRLRLPGERLRRRPIRRGCGLLQRLRFAPEVDCERCHEPCAKVGRTITRCGGEHQPELEANAAEVETTAELERGIRAREDARWDVEA